MQKKICINLVAKLQHERDDYCGNQSLCRASAFVDCQAIHAVSYGSDDLRWVAATQFKLTSQQISI